MQTQPGRDQRHEQITRGAAVALTVAAAAGSATSMVTYLAGMLGADRQEGLGGLIPVIYLAVATALLAIGLAAHTPDRRRRSLWVAALLLAPAALYLLPVWWLSVPLLPGLWVPVSRPSSLDTGNAVSGSDGQPD